MARPIDSLLAAGYGFLVSRSLEHLTIAEDNDYYEPDFYLLETRYLGCFLFEYAATLGLIDIAFLHPDDGYIN